MTFAELGENVYGKMVDGRLCGSSDDADLKTFRTRIEGLQAELRQREKALKEILEGEQIKTETKGDEKEEGKEEEGKEEKIEEKKEDKEKETAGKTRKSTTRAKEKQSAS
jgi:hypothetical protein